MTMFIAYLFVLILCIRSVIGRTFLNHQANNFAFGDKVALDGLHLVVSDGYEPIDDCGGYNCGMVYIFTRSSDSDLVDDFSWDTAVALSPLTGTLEPPGSGDSNWGSSLAVINGRVAVGYSGASWAGTCSTSTCPIGQAHIFHESVPGAMDWGLSDGLDVLRPSDGAHYDDFGVAIAVEEAIIFVGVAYRSSTYRSTASGAVYIYTESTHGQRDWTERILLASDSATCGQCRFGSRLFVHKSQGTGLITLAASAIWHKGLSGVNNGQGAVYVYSTADWSIDPLTEHLWFGPEIAQTYYGWDLAVYETRIVTNARAEFYSEISRGDVYVYSESSPGAQDWLDNTVILNIEEEDFDIDTSVTYGHSVAMYDTLLVVSVASLVGKLNELSLYYGYRESVFGAGDWATQPVYRFYNAEGSNVQDIAIRGNLIAIGEYYSAGTVLQYAGHVVLEKYCDGLDRYFPCNCEGLKAVDKYCETECQYDTPEMTPTSTLMTFPLWTQCDCTGTNAVGVACDSVCEPGSFDDPSNGFTQCDCTALNAVRLTCHKSCYNGFPDAMFENCNCTESGATGTYCTNDIDDCESSPCGNGGTCSDFGADLFPNHAHEFNCSCGSDSPYMGPTCEDTLCFSSPCLNDGTCINGQDFVCNCTGGYEGEFCQTEVDECASNPCLNDGDCTDLLGDFTCDCAETGYEGLTCAIDVDDCSSSPCENDGVCQDKGKNKFKCNCNEFWEGDVCTDDIDDCILKGYYCENGAACSDDPVNMGDVMCDCSISVGGFTGKYCDVPIEDACVTFNPCANGGKCILDDITKAMSCDCRDTGYEGDVCDVQVYVSECVSSPCLNEGQCYDPSDQQDDWYCECTAGYFGDLCDTTACDSNPCQNGGTCLLLVANDYMCTCAENYSGSQCQINDDEQVQLVSSSSSSGDVQHDDAEIDNSTKQSQDDNDVLIIFMVVGAVVTLLLAGGFYYWLKQPKHYVMPT